MDDEGRRVGAHLAHEHIPIVDEVGAFATDMRVRHLDNADGSHGMPPSRVRICRPFYREPGRRRPLTVLCKTPARRQSGLYAIAPSPLCFTRDNSFRDGPEGFFSPRSHWETSVTG